MLAYIVNARNVETNTPVVLIFVKALHLNRILIWGYPLIWFTGYEFLHELE